MKGTIVFWALIFLGYWLFHGDECSEYSDFSCEEIQEAKYNVYFYFPDGRDEYLGETEGLSNCGDIAANYAAEKELSRADWSWICCMITPKSSCQEKHR